MSTLLIDLVVEDHSNDEYVLCLVEAGPWEHPLEDRLRLLQERLYNSFDAIVDGHLVAKFPKSKNRKIRIQVDAHDSPPPEVAEYVKKFSDHLQGNSEYQQSIARSAFVSALRVVNGAELGRNFD